MGTMSGLIFLGFSLVLAAFILISVKTYQVNPDLIKKIFKYLIIGTFIFSFSIAAVIIGIRIDDRHTSSYSKNRKQVEDIWGGAILQSPPEFYEQYLSYRTVYRDEKPIKEPYYEHNIFGLVDHDVTVQINSNIRQKGLLKFAGYDIEFKGKFKIKNTFNVRKKLHFDFPLPSNAGNISDFEVRIDNNENNVDKNLADGFQWIGLMAPGQSKWIEIQYKAKGTGIFRYELGRNKLEIKNFHFTANTNYDEYLIPNRAMVPTGSATEENNLRIQWESKNLITGQDIALKFQVKGNYGETAYRLFYYSPLALALFTMLILVFSVAKEINLHPMHYLFLMTGFFIFYLLSSYLITYIPVFWGIITSVAVSTGIMVYYAHMLKKEIIFLQSVLMGSIIFQWIFSIAFFFPAHTGFTITIASIISFIILMKQTASVDWDKKW